MLHSSSTISPRAIPAKPRRQGVLVRTAIVALAVAATAGAVALSAGSDDAPRPVGRFPAPRIENVAPATRFDDVRVVKGARGGTFDDPVVSKGAAGAPLP